MGRGPCTSAKEFEFVRLLEGVADVTKIDPNGETADRLAAIFGSFEYGEYVLPAFSAAKNGMPGGLRVLAKLAGKLAPDVLLAKTDTFMQTPVHFAAIYGSDTCLRAFYELCGESAFYVHAPDRITPVHSAATHGKVDCLRVFKALCSHPRALSTPDEIGMTPVHCAARKGHLSFLSELLQGHLNVGMLFTATAVTATARAYLRPLDRNASYRWRLLAMRYKDKFEHEVLKKESVVLPHLALPAPLDELPQPHFKNESFRHLPHDLQVVIRVMQNLWDVDYYGDTPAHHAAKGGHPRVLDLLRKAGAQSTLVARSYNANLDIGDGRTPAHYAARNGHPGCLIALHRLVADYDLSNGASSSNLVRRSSGDNISRSVDLFGVKANNGETPALDAARAGRNECLKVICGLGARRTLYERDKWECTVAHMAVRGVHSSTLHVINELIGTQILMGSDKDGMTPAHYAARHGRDECLRVLHELLGTESLCAIDKAGMTPAHYAALYGHHGCLGLLQQFGADKSLRAKCNKGNAPVHLAAMGGHDKCLRILESYLNMRTCDGRTAAHVAAACNEPVSLRLMYKELGFPYGLGDYATRDFKERTPAHYAAMRGSEECLRVLYQVDENLSAEDEDGSTPAHEAAKNGKEGCLRALGGELHAVHTLSALDNQANTPAHYAAAKGWPQCLRAMHELNIESVFLIGDAYDCLPAHYAAEQGHYACLRALCVRSVKSNLTAPDRYGQTPAHYAAKMDSRPCLEQLCQLVGYETFSAVDNKGRTCSHYAAENGHEACIRLLSKVSDLTVADREGETPIHLAARNRQLSMVDVLRGLGVDINIRNSLTGLTPVHYLARAGDEESLHRLVQSGSLDLATKSAWLRSLLQTKFGDRSKLLLKDQPRDKVLNGLLKALFADVDKSAFTFRIGSEVRPVSLMTLVLASLTLSDHAKAFTDAGFDEGKQGVLNLLLLLHAVSDVEHLHQQYPALKQLLAPHFATLKRWIARTRLSMPNLSDPPTHEEEQKLLTNGIQDALRSATCFGASSSDMVGSRLTLENVVIVGVKTIFELRIDTALPPEETERDAKKEELLRLLREIDPSIEIEFLKYGSIIIRCKCAGWGLSDGILALAEEGALLGTYTVLPLDDALPEVRGAKVVGFEPRLCATAGAIENLRPFGVVSPTAIAQDTVSIESLNGGGELLVPFPSWDSADSALPATPIDVTFINEVSYGDALRREWFGLVLNELVECGVFVNTNGTLHPNPEAGSREQQLYFTVSGWLAGLALLHGETLNHRWSIGFLKAAFGYKTTFDDIRSVDPELHQNLAAMRKMSVEELDQMCQFFVAEDRAWTRKRGSSSKRPREVALIEGGADVQVTHQTLEKFLLHYAKHVVDDDELLCGYGPYQIQAFTRGLNVFVSQKTAKRVRGYCDVLDIQMTLSGFSQINSEQVDQWRQSTVYVPEGFANAPQVQWLWEIIRDDTWSEKRSKLLRFCTGSERVPAGGFDRLMGYDDGSSDQPLQRFTVSLALTLTSDHLPTASSCFNKLNLPMYRTKEELLTKLELALQETRGFDLSG